MTHTTTQTYKPVLSHTSLSAVLLALLALILFVSPALAAVPVEGTVYEGKGVPGVTLGATRAQVLRIYGKPTHCGSISTSRTYTCTFNATGGGTVAISFKRTSQSMVPVLTDIVTFIRWSQEVDGWKTTAGINTKLAIEYPEVVVKAYPDAIVKYNAAKDIIQVRDSRLGIQVDWVSASNPKDGQWRVSMAIFPSTQIKPPDN